MSYNVNISIEWLDSQFRGQTIPLNPFRTDIYEITPPPIDLAAGLYS